MKKHMARLVTFFLMISSSLLFGSPNDVISLWPPTDIPDPALSLKNSLDFKIACSNQGAVLFWVLPDGQNHDYYYSAVGSADSVNKKFDVGNIYTTNDFGSRLSTALAPDGGSMLIVHTDSNDNAIHYMEGSINYPNHFISWNVSPGSTMTDQSEGAFEGAAVQVTITNDNKICVLNNSADGSKIWWGFDRLCNYKGDDPGLWPLYWQENSTLSAYPFDSSFIDYNDDSNCILAVSSINSNSKTLYLQIASAQVQDNQNDPQVTITNYTLNTNFQVKPETYDSLGNPVLTHRILCPYVNDSKFPILVFFKTPDNKINYVNGYFNGSSIKMQPAQSVVPGLSGDAIDHFEAYASSDYTKIFLTCYDTTKNELLADVGTINNVSGAPSTVTWLPEPVVIGEGSNFQNFKSSVSHDFSKFTVMYKDENNDYHVQAGTINVTL